MLPRVIGGTRPSPIAVPLVNILEVLIYGIMKSRITASDASDFRDTGPVLILVEPKRERRAYCPAATSASNPRFA